MSLHKLAEVTIAVYGLPEHCGTDEALQELTESAEEVIHRVSYERLILQRIRNSYPELLDKIEISIKGS